MTDAIRDNNFVPVSLGADDTTGVPKPFKVDASGRLLVTAVLTGVTVPNGGTGVTSFTAYAPIFGGTTSTGALQSGTVGTTGQVLTSNGAGALPTFQTGGSGTVTSVSVTTANGVSGSVATATTTPAISITLGAITPTTVNGNTITTGSGTLTLAAGKTLTASNSITLAGTDGKTLTLSKTMQLTAADDTGVYTLPTGTKTLVASDVTTLSSLVSVGTITTGTWTGTTIAAANGGTGRASHTAYAVICGGTTTTAAQQSIASVGTSGQVLTSNGAGALPTFQTASSGGTDLFSTTNFTFSGQFVASAMSRTLAGTGAFSNDASFGYSTRLDSGAVTGGTALAALRLGGFDGTGFLGYAKNMSFRCLFSLSSSNASFTTHLYAGFDSSQVSDSTIYMGLRIAGTTVNAVTKDGTTEQLTDISGSFGTLGATLKVLDIIFTSGTSVVFKINGATVATHSTNIPLASNTTSEWIPWGGKVNNGAANANCALSWGFYAWQRAF